MTATLETTAPWHRRPAPRFGAPSGHPRRNTWSPEFLAAAIAAAFVCALLVCLSGHLLSDSYLDLYAGRFVAEHGIPHHELFTSAAHGHNWIDQQWLAQWLYYCAWRAFGYAGMVLLSAALIGSAFGLFIRALLRWQVGPVRACGWTLLATIGCLSNTAPRAQSFAYPLFVLVVVTVVDDTASTVWRKRLLFLVPVLALWGNLHGSVLLGAGMVVVYAGWRAIRAMSLGNRRSAAGYLGLAGLAICTPLVTPYGPGILGYYQSVLGNKALTRSVSEWAPPSVWDGVSVLYFVVLLVVLVTVTLSVVRCRRLPAVPCLLAGFLMVLSLRSVRYEIWFVIAGVAAAALVGRTDLARPSRLTRATAFHLPMAVGAGSLLLMAILIAALTPTAETERGVTRELLVAADKQSAQIGGAPVLADALQSAALLWLRPGSAGRVAYDIRFEQFSEQELSSYLNFLDGDPGSLAFADRYQLILLGRSHHANTIRELRHDSQWHVSKQSSLAVLFVRDGGGA